MDGKIRNWRKGVGGWGVEGSNLMAYNPVSLKSSLCEERTCGFPFSGDSKCKSLNSQKKLYKDKKNLLLNITHISVF